MDKNAVAQSDELRFQTDFNKLVNSIHSSSNPNAIMVGLRKKILTLFSIEMATIFLVDSVKKQLVSWVLLPGSALQKIRIPIDLSSICGFVARSGELVNINNVRDDEELKNLHAELRFDSRWDDKGTTMTKQVLATPIKHSATLLGVVEFMNREDGKRFDSVDETRIKELAETLGIALYNHYKVGNKIPLRYDELVSLDLITSQELDRAFAISTQKEMDVESVLINNFRVSKSELGEVLARFYKTRYIDLSDIEYQPEEFFDGINVDYFKKALILPLRNEGGTIILAAQDPSNQGTIDEVIQILRVQQAKVLFAFREDIEKILEKCQGSTTPDTTSAEMIEEKTVPTALTDQLPKKKAPKYDIYTKPKKKKFEGKIGVDDRPVVMLVRKIIEDGYKAKASDIHIEPYGKERDSEVRYRVDGTCSHVLNIPNENIKAVIARIKVLADLNISERRKPQDGKIKFRTNDGKKIELRVATVPTAKSDEDVVLRILADSKPLDLKTILPPKIFNDFNELIKKPYGIILVVGPTGSGKTTTLHSALHLINTPEKKIWTAEDPVEITQYRLRQVQVKPYIGYTFAAAMRAFLRADPDIIMVGEMRDQETAKIAIEASLTGHLVFSTLHTNAAPETITRLIDMGIDTFNFADSLQGILAQRLVRTLCPKCKEPYLPDRSEYDHLVQNYGILFYDNIRISYSENLIFYKAGGCSDCGDTGYKGRIGIYELLTSNLTIKELIIRNATVEEIRQEAINGGMTILLQEGIHRIFDGLTDYNQVMSVCAQ